MATVSSTPSSAATRPLYFGSQRISQLSFSAYSGAKSVRIVTEVLPQYCGTNQTLPSPAAMPVILRKGGAMLSQVDSFFGSIGWISPASRQRGTS